jgi:hypothetical protein
VQKDHRSAATLVTHVTGGLTGGEAPPGGTMHLDRLQGGIALAHLGRGHMAPDPLIQGRC